MKISIIIPTLNSVKYLPSCLKAIAEGISLPDEYEVIIVDNGSADDTLRISEGFGAQVLQDRLKTVAGLRNWAVSQAKGDVLFFLDSDCVVRPGWLQEACGILKDDHIKVAGCWYDLPENATWVQRAWDSHMSRRRQIAGETDWIPSGNLWIRNDVFKGIGGFSEDLQTGEDTDFCRRLRESGFKIISVPNLTVVHLGEASSLGVFFKKQLWHGRGGIQRFVREFPVYVFDKTFIFSCIMLMCFIGIVISGLMKAAGMAILFLAGMLCIPVMLSLKSAMRRNDFQYAPALIFLYLIYGLARMVSFLNIGLWISETKKRKGNILKQN